MKPTKDVKEVLETYLKVLKTNLDKLEDGKDLHCQICKVTACNMRVFLESVEWEDLKGI